MGSVRRVFNSPIPDKYMSIFRLLHRHHQDDTFLRNFIFGVEDSLVSTVGLLAGVATADLTGRAILTTGIVLIVVEGFSMGIGSFVTEETTEEMTGSTPHPLLALKGGLIMLFSYIVAGFIPLAPYLFLRGYPAILTSVISSLIGLWLLGYSTAIWYHRPRPVRRATRMFLLGGFAVSIGMLIGNLFHL
ncbi:MAG: hypothetical protein UX38_C0007G0008 [Microgenomates group bacterium GW2011_GWC1_46_16]|uniref:VIT family protein n=1 Tax=Candidatus Collierbacteria bacterium RIFOXYA2_FULL_46_10 TaxID=1817726 RepID=A0A1F5F399_9BACT|nr:MAG: hypothetical protein UX32_C0008G0009 [Microgenomates group bacterium GW2011_GWF1_46_12]KKU26271.1 MAG: hypothetical protein UX38_C0007G0008 [Microgenomates group bacterium GW2011_GWC1_46_16]KKU27638.1 MAG: hypothetical protein UX40_C0009G0008 [Microgenomates group bacterium GW2011_GWF2_46_18]KKU45359.1 MAG: hypothetical protein UX63_C0007G0009 [Microgenomates group bacterium GW2011_GWB1_46_7]KKU61048.1 MAG: hypothetical protein UX82_C0005G0010 [Microgenomates group bacterium GW2011_GWE1